MKDNGSIIAELRKEAGYTQKTLADVLHITDKAVSKWERGICQPDSSLLPKLSVLLGVDIELLLSDNQMHSEGWIGLLDFENYDVDLSEKIFDKPMVYYMLVHFQLLNIMEIYIRTTKENEEYLSQPLFQKLGFTFIFDFVSLPNCNVMILNRPLFLFGSDLSRQLQGAIATNSLIKMVPVNQKHTFLFCPSEYAFLYLKNRKYLYQIAGDRTEGRGVISIELSSSERISDASMFVRLYQSNSNLLVACLEEIAYKNGIVDKEFIADISQNVPYGYRLRNLIEDR